MQNHQASPIERRSPAPGLREWARGSYPLEAAVELLIRACGGRFATPARPWIRPGDRPGSYWLDTTQVSADITGCYSGGERRLLAVVASLAGGEPIDLGDVVCGIDRATVALVLAAVAHASGSHEQSLIALDDVAGTANRGGLLPSLYPWPQPADAPVGTAPQAGTV